MEQMIYNILLALSLLLNAYYILKLEHEAKLDRLKNDKAVESQNKHITELALSLTKIDERLSEAEKRLEELPITAMEEEAERMRAFNDGIGEIMSFNPDVPKLNKDGLRHG